jgi:hypothetical protein
MELTKIIRLSVQARGWSSLFGHSRTAKGSFRLMTVLFAGARAK